MSSWAELDDAVKVLQNSKVKDLIILQCVSEYPCLPENSGLNVINQIKERYDNVKVGYSDHTIGLAVPIAAVSLGATVIEKHFTLSKKMYGSDAVNSTEPHDFKILVDEIRKVDLAIASNIDKDAHVKKLKNMKTIFEKSIYASRDLPKGTKITFDMLSFKKPGTGIPTKFYKDFIGKKIKKSILTNHKFTSNDFV